MFTFREHIAKISNEFRGVGVLMVRHLTLNLALGNKCRLRFVESFEFVYAQFHEFC